MLVFFRAYGEPLRSSDTSDWGPLQDILSPDPRNERGEEGSQPVLIPLMIPNMMDQRVQKHYVFTLISNQLKHNTKTQCF